jgi:acyl carrier protein
MSKTEIANTIRALFESKPILAKAEPDQDFFDLGASSLTIVDVQLQIEEELGAEVETSSLMAKPTLNDWVDAYSASLSEKNSNLETAA